MNFPSGLNLRVRKSSASGGSRNFFHTTLCIAGLRTAPADRNTRVRHARKLCESSLGRVWEHPAERVSISLAISRSRLELGGVDFRSSENHVPVLPLVSASRSKNVKNACGS